jgi:hypothetical protein
LVVPQERPRPRRRWRLPLYAHEVQPITSGEHRHLSACLRTTRTDRWVHAHHHKSYNPTALSGISMTPLESTAYISAGIAATGSSNPGRRPGGDRAGGWDRAACRARHVGHGRVEGVRLSSANPVPLAHFPCQALCHTTRCVHRHRAYSRHVSALASRSRQRSFRSSSARAATRSSTSVCSAGIPTLRLPEIRIQHTVESHGY